MDYVKAFSAFKGKRILVIGDLILDRYIFGRVNRISQEAPVPIVEVTEESFLLGGAANVANNIVALGGIASVAGLVGKDRAGSVMRELLRERRIADQGVIEDKRPTTIKTRVIAHHQQVVRYDREDSRKLEGATLELMLDYLKPSVGDHDAVIVSDYRKGVVSSAMMKALLSYGRPYGTFVAVDPKVGHFHCYKKVTLVTPNLAEAAEGSGVEIRDEKSLIKAGETLMQKLACGSVLITRGERGMSLFDRNRKGSVIRVTHIPTVAKKVFDVTGAGDTVIATFTLARAAGCSSRDAAVIANHAAGIVVGEVGTAVATPEQVLQSLTLG